MWDLPREILVVPPWRSFCFLAGGEELEEREVGSDMVVLMDGDGVLV